MKLELEIEGRSIEADFSVADGIAQMVHGGRSYEASVSEPEPGSFVLIFNNRVYRCVIEKLAAGETYAIVNGLRLRVTVRDKKRMVGNRGPAGSGGGRVILSSPMPGKVVRILLSAGDPVGAHQGVLVVEAMKMQNEIQSPRAGVVTEISVSEGQTVNGGEVLAVIE